jgi:hypothetical protein
MSDDFGFAAPPFKADEALLKLKRDLRELGLAEREGRFERRGSTLARAAVDGDLIVAARVRKPSRSSPEWLERRLRSSADVRDFVADLKKQLALWSDRDD